MCVVTVILWETRTGVPRVHPFQVKHVVYRSIHKTHTMSRIPPENAFYTFPIKPANRKHKK
jgi:hypothetical protein